MLPLDTWPDFSPNAIGTRKLRQNPHDDLLERVIERAGLAAIDHLAEDNSRTPSNLPASFNCISMRSMR